MSGHAAPQWLPGTCARGCQGLAVPGGSDLCLDCLLAVLGITYRQLDYWARSGYLSPAGGGGQGRTRIWPMSELAIAGRMGRLTAAGLDVEQAAAFARDTWPSGEIAPGIALTVIAGEDLAGDRLAADDNEGDEAQ